MDICPSLTIYQSHIFLFRKSIGFRGCDITILVYFTFIPSLTVTGQLVLPQSGGRGTQDRIPSYDSYSVSVCNEK